jgi:lysophospholipase L1-like esterase
LSAPCASPAQGLLAGLLLVATSTALAATPPWDLKDGDRVVLVGDTFIEREQRYGYLETALTLANADKHVTFRNLGWSGDTVRGLSRAGFDPPEAGFRELIKQVTGSKPTVLVVGYGMAESFEGEAGLPRFVEGYNAFLDAVAPLNARLILLSPLPHEKLPAPLPDPAPHNRDLKLYTDAIRSIAAARGAAFVDLFASFTLIREVSENVTPRLAFDTDNGIHLTEAGYWRLAMHLESGTVAAPIGNPAPSFQLEPPPASVETTLIPPPAVPDVVPDWMGERNHRVIGLPPGRYTLKLDGRALLTRTAEEWANFQKAPPGPETEKIEALRKAIIAKNLLFFYRWRPQNITYLFGFRKHEQGQNAVEVPQFDPLVEAKEKEITELLKAIPRNYELVRETEPAR